MDSKRKRTHNTPGSERRVPLEMSPEAFRIAGHRLVDAITAHLSELRGLPITRGENPEEIRRALGGDGLPEEGMDGSAILNEVTPLLFEHSLFNGHPKFFGYITSSAAPIGALGDFLAASVNANVGAWQLSPLATEIELQTIRWIAELIGFPVRCGGVLVSGGNMANFVGILAARRAQAAWDVRTEGLTYPLSGEPLLRSATRGISNSMDGPEARVTHGEGALLLIHYRGR